jgi:ribosome modulation factor
MNHDAFEHGYLAHQAGCYRVLCCPANDEELAEWLAGWDAAAGDQTWGDEDVVRLTSRAWIAERTREEEPVFEGRADGHQP